MEFFKRIWNAIKMVAQAAVGFVAGPFINLVKGEVSGPVMVWSAVGALVRTVFALSFFVAVPAIVMAFVKLWLLTALTIFGFFVIVGAISLLFVPSEIIENALEDSEAAFESALAKTA